MKVLLVDDENEIRNITKSMISGKDYIESISEAENGSIALDMCEKNDFDLIITDLSMPIMDGLSFMKALNKAKPLPPIIVVTGNILNFNIHEILVYKSLSVLSKPFGRASLLSLLDKMHQNPDKYTFQERRRFARLPVSIKATINDKYPVNISNIGLGGCLLESDNKIPLKSFKHPVHIKIGTFGSFAENIKSKIIGCEENINKNTCSVSFYEIDNNLKRFLTDLLYERSVSDGHIIEKG